LIYLGGETCFLRDGATSALCSSEQVTSDMSALHETGTPDYL